MRKYKNIFAVLLLAFSGLFSSCSEWLKLYPEDEIIEDEYWSSSSDVDMVVAGAYRYMLESNVLQRFVYLGEMRSDNIQAGSTNSNESNVLNNGNLESDNSMCDWSSFYKVINICNNVIEKAPKVREVDSNYLQSDLEHHLGEALFIRSLCYFYLVRGWGDVPYATTSSSSDEIDYNRPAMNADSLVDVLISDMEQAKSYATPSYGTQAKNCGKVTKNACRALLADLYLWKGNNQACIRECDEVLSSYQPLPGSTQTEWQLLDRNNFYYQVFASGNSDESIFELNLNDQNNANLNVFTSLYGNATTSPHFLPTTNLVILYDDKDARGFQYINVNNDHIFKYVGMIPPTAESKQEIGSSSYTFRANSSAPNWIVYRLADIYLMKAEALAVSGTTESDFDQVVTLCNKTYVRSHPEGADSLDHNSVKDNNAALAMVLTERRREFAFEGKRWFDLLREVRRNGGPTEAVISELVNNKYNGISPDGISGKLSSIGYWYWPIYKDEIDVNPNLHQNAYYSLQESDNQ